MSRSPVAALSEAERAEDMFFAALRTADAAELEELVGEDLLLVDVRAEPSSAAPRSSVRCAAACSSSTASSWSSA